MVFSWQGILRGAGRPGVCGIGAAILFLGLAPALAGNGPGQEIDHGAGIQLAPPFLSWGKKKSPLEFKGLGDALEVMFYPNCAALGVIFYPETVTSRLSLPVRLL